MFGRKKCKNDEWQMDSITLREQDVICVAKNENGKVGYYKLNFASIDAYIELDGKDQSKLIPFQNFRKHTDSNYDEYFASTNYKIGFKELIKEAFSKLGITKDDLNPAITPKWNGWMLELFNEGESNAIK